MKQKTPFLMGKITIFKNGKPSISMAGPWLA
jgi:hypothetical protein